MFDDAVQVALDQLPHNASAERAVIGIVLRDPGWLSDEGAAVQEAVFRALTPAAFFTQRLREIAAVMCDLRDRIQVVDVVTVAQNLDPSDPNAARRELEALEESAPVTDSAAYHWNVVGRAYRLRQLLAIGTLATESGDDLAATAQRMKAEIDRIMAGSVGPHGPDLPILADATEAELDWLIPEWVPAATYSLLVGEAGRGKSTLLVNWMASLTRAGATVLLYAPEDSVGTTTKPRLDYAGADMQRVRLLALPDTQPLTLPQGVRMIEDYIRRYRAELVVLDPILSLLGERTDAYKAQHVRAATQPLTTLAQTTGAAIVGVAHPGKNKSAVGYQMIAGSSAFGEVARLVNALLVDPEDPTARALVRLKGNAGVEPAPLRFTLESHPTNGAIARVAWCSSSRRSGQDLLDLNATAARRPRMTEAVAFLNDLLLGGAVPATVVQAEAKKAGISMDTIRDAKEHMGLVTRKRRDGWEWERPDEAPGA